MPHLNVYLIKIDYDIGSVVLIVAKIMKEQCPNIFSFKQRYGENVSDAIYVDGNEITVADSLKGFFDKTRQASTILQEGEPIRNWSIRFKNQDRRDLSTYLHLGDNHQNPSGLHSSG